MKSGRICSDWIKPETIAKHQRQGRWYNPVVITPWEWRASKKENKQDAPHIEATPPEIIRGEKSKTDSNESWFSKLGKSLTQVAHRGENSTKRQYKCDGRTHCSQMTSCEEAKFFLKNCPGTNGWWRRWSALSNNKKRSKLTFIKRHEN